MSAEFEIKGLRKAFGTRQVLDGLDLTIARGENLVVIGQSGSGKSLLLRSILGLEVPDAGQILWRGQVLDARRRAAFMDGFGMLFQGAGLFDSLPVWRNVAFRLLQSMPAARARAIAVDKLARVGLGPEVAEMMPAELSGGMAKRVGLARAIAADPQVIFFDEPTTGLDPIRATMIDRLIRSIVTETGATAITITHDIASMRHIADRVALLHKGKLRWHGPVEAVDMATDPVLRAFLAGEPDAAL
ncbi:MAG: ATP-binding cassette domain-containing protein [Paracoccus sp. (in: a-proteobacteria)]|uniref:ABC transporter ATP-binding protein n=1 Tax=Paracoccus sp. TaxID=267 RepID=UPI0026DF2C06|nr:ATP-binding cassette domain-containing protein [Paracoccus sp. (in: a-proteobacteria)]MDO5622667.1 ATP-binding cassette domain-containing protein [Paracoccus sp. (in: a-proteobacteria)]